MSPEALAILNPHCAKGRGKRKGNSNGKWKNKSSKSQQDEPVAEELAQAGSKIRYLMAWDSLMDFQGAQSQKEGRCSLEIHQIIPKLSSILILKPVIGKTAGTGCCPGC